METTAQLIGLYDSVMSLCLLEMNDSVMPLYLLEIRAVYRYSSGDNCSINRFVRFGYQNVPLLVGDTRGVLVK